MASNETKKAGGLAAALLVAQRSLQAVEKDATNSFHRYAYVSAEQMIGAARSALHSAGLVVFRREWNLREDGVSVFSLVEVAHPDSGERMLCDFCFPVVCEKGRPIDKAVAGALTTSLSYFLRDLLLVPREDEGAMDRRDDRPTQPQPAVGWKPEPKPEPKPQKAPPGVVEDRVAELNEAKRKLLTETGELGNSYSKQAGGVSVRCVDFVSSDGKRRSFLIGEVDIEACEGQMVEATFFLRGTKFPQLVGVKQALPDIPLRGIGEEADDDLPAF